MKSRTRVHYIKTPRMFRTVRTMATMPQVGFLSKPEVLCRVLGVVSSFRNAPPTSTIAENASFTTDLGFDCMRKEELVGKLEKDFCVPFPAGKADSYSSVDSVVEYFSQHPKAK